MTMCEGCIFNLQNCLARFSHGKKENAKKPCTNSQVLIDECLNYKTCLQAFSIDLINESFYKNGINFHEIKKKIAYDDAGIDCSCQDEDNPGHCANDQIDE